MNDLLPLLLIGGLAYLAYEKGWLTNLLSGSTATVAPAATTAIVPAAGSPLATSTIAAALPPVQSVAPVIVGSTTPASTVINPAYTTPAILTPVSASPNLSRSAPPAQPVITPVGSSGSYVSGGATSQFSIQQIHDMMYNAVGASGAAGAYEWGYTQWNGLLQQLTGITLPNPGPDSGLPLWQPGSGFLTLDGNSMSYAYWPWAALQLQNMGLQGLRGMGALGRTRAQRMIGWA